MNIISKQTNKQRSEREIERSQTTNQYTRIEMSKLIKRNSYANLCFQRKKRQRIKKEKLHFFLFNLK